MSHLWQYHAPFADLNNMQMADLLGKFLKETGLDGRNAPHKGASQKQLKASTNPIEY